MLVHHVIVKICLTSLSGEEDESAIKKTKSEQGKTQTAIITLHIQLVNGSPTEEQLFISDS